MTKSEELKQVKSEIAELFEKKDQVNKALAHDRTELEILDPVKHKDLADGIQDKIFDSLSKLREINYKIINKWEERVKIQSELR